MMGNVELAPEVDVSALEPLLSPHVVSELLDTYMSTLTVSRTVRAQGADAAAAVPGGLWPVPWAEVGRAPAQMPASCECTALCLGIGS